MQRRLAAGVVRRGGVRPLRLACGADIAFTLDGRMVVAGAVVWDVSDQEVVEQRVVRRAVRFPYVPGLLSFREAPALLAVLRKLRAEPDVFLFDGQGFAHPRRFGLASHVGLLIDRPSIGCAKSVLLGKFETPAAERGSRTPLVDGRQRIGTVLRTRSGVRPLFISVGHRVSLPAAERVVLACCTEYRLPEPTRLADRLVARARLSPRGTRSCTA